MGAGVLWGTTGTTQALSPYANTPLGLGAARLVVAAVALVLLALGVGRRGRITARHLPMLLVAAGGVAAYQPAFFFAARQTGVAVGTLTAIGSAPLFAGLLGALTGTRPSRRWAVATAVILAGLGLLLLPGGALRFDAAGVAAGLAAGAAYAAYTWASARLLDAGVPPATLLAGAFAGAAVVLVLGAPADAAAWFARPERIVVVVYLGLVATVVPYLLWARGLATTRPAVATTLSLTEPLTAALLGVLVLSEAVTPAGLAGAATVCAGLLLAVTAAPERDREEVSGL